MAKDVFCPHDAVIINWVANILDPVASRRQMTALPGTTIGEAIKMFVPVAPAGFEVIACLNGEVLQAPRHDIALCPGDNLVMAARPEGGGGGGSNPLQVVGMIAVVVVAAIATYGAASFAYAGGVGFGAGSFATIGGASLSVGGLAFAAGAGAAVAGLGGALLSSAFKNKTPDYGAAGADAFGSSPSYSWNIQANPLAEGTALPVLYGKFLVTPPLIARHVDSVGKKQHLNLLYAIAGHKIDAVESVYINEQLREVYSDTELEVRLGDVEQAVIPFFGDLREEVSVNAKLTAGEWVQRELPGSIQGFCACLNYRLYYANDAGGMDKVSARVEMEYRKKGEEAWTRYTELNSSPVTVTEYHWSAGYNGITGWIELVKGSTNPKDHAEGDYYNYNWGVVSNNRDRATRRPAVKWRWIGAQKVLAAGTVQQDYLSLTSNDPNTLRYVVFRDYVEEGGYEVRFRLRNALTESSRHGSDVYLEYVQTIQYDDFTYPCVALGAIRALSTDQLSGGIPVVQILAARNSVLVFNPYTNTYEKKAATNPAWASYDALHNGAPGHPLPEIYGGRVPSSRIVYDDFAEWAAYCDLKGYKCNIYIESPSTVRFVLDQLGMAGRGNTFQVGSKFTCIFDRPRVLPRQQFLVTRGNIIAKTLKKEWIEMQDRANSLEVTYFDKESLYTRQTVKIFQQGFDSGDRAEIPAQRTLFWCDNRKDALMWGRGMLNRNRYLTYTPSFETGVEAIHCLPGDLISLAEDEIRGGVSGRIVSADASQVVLDAKVTMLPKVQYAIDMQHLETDERALVYVVGVNQETETDTLLLATAMSTPLPADSKYAFGEVGRITREFTVLEMRTAQDMRKRIHCLEYAPEVYDESAANISYEDDSQRAFVRDLRLTEIWMPGGPDGSGRSVIGASWRGNALYWTVYLREKVAGQAAIEGWQRVAMVSEPRCRIETALVNGQAYEVSVSIGAPEDGEISGIEIVGKLAPPNDVENFRAEVKGDSILLYWDHVPDADLAGYVIRAGASWDSATEILDTVTENTASWNPPMSSTYRLWIKARDQSGIYSQTAVDALISIELSNSLNIVWQSEELAGGAEHAELNYLAMSGDGSRLLWVPGMTDTDAPALTDLDISGYMGDGKPGVYVSQVYDLGAEVPFSMRLHAEIDSHFLRLTDLTYPARTNLSYPRDTDVSVTSLSGFAAEYRFAGENEEWGEWLAWSGIVNIGARYFQLRFSTKIEEQNVNFAFTRISGLADVPDQHLIFKASIPAGGRFYTFEELGLRPMLLEYHVGVTVLGGTPLAPATEFEAQRFFVKIFDSQGNAHAAETSIEIRGF